MNLRTALQDSNQLLYSFGGCFVWPIADVQFYVLLLAIASCEVPHFKCLFHEVPFICSLRNRLEWTFIHWLAIVVVFITDFHRQGVTLVSSPSGFGTFSNQLWTPWCMTPRVTPLIIETMDNPRRYVDKSRKFAYCVVVGTPKHDSIFFSTLTYSFQEYVKECLTLLTNNSLTSEWITHST